MLAVMVFALIFGIALTQIPPERRVSLTGVLEGLFDVSMVIIGFAMWLAPFGIACLMFAMTSRLGGDILYTLVWFVGTVLLGIGIQMFVVYSILIWFFTKRSPLEFFRATQEALLTAFGTSSSNATLPTSLKVAEEKLGLPQEISRFVLNDRFNGQSKWDGTYEGVVVLFLAQVFNVELNITQQLTVVLMSVLAGVDGGRECQADRSR